MKKRELVVEVIVFLFVVLFLYAAESKLTDYQHFIGQIGKSPLLTNFAGTIAWMIPVIEIIVCILLVIPRFRMIGFYAAFGLMTIFTFYIIAILSFSAVLPCSCGGILSTMGWKEHLIFNIAFVGLALTGIILMNKREPEQNKIVTA